jgi:hypothetical protein
MRKPQICDRDADITAKAQFATTTGRRHFVTSHISDLQQDWQHRCRRIKDQPHSALRLLNRLYPLKFTIEPFDSVASITPRLLSSSRNFRHDGSRDALCKPFQYRDLKKHVAAPILSTR